MNRNTPWRTTRGNRLLALASGKDDWYRIRNATASTRAQVHIYDEIGFLGKTAQEFIRDLEDIDGPIDLHLNSPGGEVFDGVAIYNTLLAREDVDVYIDGIAASIASVIAMAGDSIYIAPSAQFMVHNAFAMACGDAQDMREMADRLEANTANVARIYAARTGQSAEYWLKLMDKESWFMGQEAVDAGLADKVIRVGRVPDGMKSKFDLSPLQRGSMAARTGQPSNAAHHRYHSHTDVHHEPMTGTHSHNHAAFGSTDGDDGIHAHSHVHQGDAVHGHPHMMHDHDHPHDHPHAHAHNVDDDSYYEPHSHSHVHHDVTGGTGDDDTHQSTDHDHDAWAATGPGMSDHVHTAIYADARFYNRAFAQADRDRMAKSGEAMPDGSYPIEDGHPEDLANAIHAVGRGTNNSHDAIRRHIIRRAKAMGRSSEIPEEWTSGGSSASDLARTTIYSDADASAFVSALRG